MNKYIKLVLFFVAVFFQLPINAQEHAQVHVQSGLTVSGIIMTEKGEPQVGVIIAVKDNPSKNTVSDLDGHFRITDLQKGQTLVFSLLGFDKKEVKVEKSDEASRIILKETINELNEAIVVGQGTERKISVTGAITNVNVNDLKVPATSVANMLAGRVPGIISVLRTGEPGKDYSQFWIRGISTFGAGSSALVLIDGVEGDINTIDPEDIQSFTILKDASATAVYGVRGANGVVLVTTKRGVAGKASISVKFNRGISYSPLMPKYVDANTYAKLANEASMSRGNDPIYNSVDLTLFKDGLDPDLHPNVNWRDVILRNTTWDDQFHIGVSGGAQVARYYMSLGVLNKDALFKQDKGVNKYNTDGAYHQYNFRANVDVNITKSTIMTLGLEDVITEQTYPGYGNSSQSLWDAQANLTPVTVPIVYSSGQLPAYGPNNDQISPYVLLNCTGYNKYYNNTSKLNLQFQQDLSMITKGLNFSALFNMTCNSSMTRSRTKTPALFYATKRKRDGTLDLQKKRDSSDPTFGVSTYVDRTYYFETNANYERLFNNAHRVTGLAHFYMQDYISSNNTTDLSAIPKRYIAFSGRLTYAFKDTYLVEGNIGYTGSEAFEKGKRFGTFPAISVGWIPTQYAFIQKNIPFIDFLKFRGSYGQVGNDQMSTRFPYLTLMGPTDSGIWNSGSGYTETQVGSSNLRWETATKSDFGIDAKFWKNRFDLTVDFYKDIRSGIYQQRASIPDEMGLVTLPFANVGKMKSWGLDGHISYTQMINKNNNTYFVLRANLTQSKNKLLHYEESIVRYPYQASAGYPYGINRGLIALGLFKDKADVANSPKQTFTSEVLPGDIKYKDVNGDGVVDWYDVVPLKYSNTPQIQYGFATEFNWKNWNISAFFEGVSRVSYFSGGNGFYPFAGRDVGNVLSIVTNNHWTSRDISGTAATENPNARFPRLTYGGNGNNNINSTFWLNNGSYLRLQNVQISYQLGAKFIRRVGINKATFSLIGDNLHVWSHVKLFDPSQASSNGSAYPLQRVFTLQLNMEF